MQLDLQSVEKVPFSTFAWAFASEILEIALPRLRMSWSFLEDLSIQSCFTLFQGPSCRKSPSALFFIQLGDPIGDCNPVESKACCRWFPATGPLEKRETALDRSWRKLQVILRQGWQIFNIFGAKAHASVLQSSFPTNCKSNCIIIGLKFEGTMVNIYPPIVVYDTAPYVYRTYPSHCNDC